MESSKFRLQHCLALAALFAVAILWCGWLWFFRRLDENTGLFTMSGIGILAGAATGIAWRRTWLAALFGTVIGGFSTLGVLAALAVGLATGGILLLVIPITLELLRWALAKVLDRLS